jgi:hypothetical protein
MIEELPVTSVSVKYICDALQRFAIDCTSSHPVLNKDYSSFIGIFVSLLSDKFQDQLVKIE